MEQMEVAQPSPPQRRRVLRWRSLGGGKRTMVRCPGPVRKARRSTACNGTRTPSPSWKAALWKAKQGRWGGLARGSHPPWGFRRRPFHGCRTGTGTGTVTHSFVRSFERLTTRQVTQRRFSSARPLTGYCVAVRRAGDPFSPNHLTTTQNPPACRQLSVGSSFPPAVASRWPRCRWWAAAVAPCLRRAAGVAAARRAGIPRQ
jgi:hypothetical protein